MSDEHGMESCYQHRFRKQLVADLDNNPLSKPMGEVWPPAITWANVDKDLWVSDKV